MSRDIKQGKEVTDTLSSMNFEVLQSEGNINSLTVPKNDVSLSDPKKNNSSRKRKI